MAALPPQTAIIWKNGLNGVEKNVKREVTTLKIAFQVRSTVKRCAGGKNNMPFCMWPHPGDVAIQLENGKVPNILVFNLREGLANEAAEVETKQGYLDDFQNDFPIEDGASGFWTVGTFIDVQHSVATQSTPLAMVATVAEPNPPAAAAAAEVPATTPAPAVNPAVKRQRVSPPKPAPKQKGRGIFTPKEQRL